MIGGLRVLLGRLFEAGAEDRVARVVGSGICPRRNGKFDVARSRGRQPGIQVSSVTTMPLKPAASARCTKLAARSRSVGVYSWKKPGVSPNSAATCFHRVGRSSSTRSSARPCARRRAPSPGRRDRPVQHRAITPTGAIITGDGNVIPNSSTERSRSLAPTNIRGISPQRSKAEYVDPLRVLVSCAASDVGPHPPAASRPRALPSNSAKAIGSEGSMPDSP